MSNYGRAGPAAEFEVGNENMNRDFLNRVVDGLDSGRIALFVGAGASRPSGLPTAPQIVDGVVDAVSNALRHPLACKGKFATSYSQRIRLEYFCRTLAEVDNRIALLPLAPLALGEPSTIHNFAAACAKAGRLRYIITTNFDLLLEKALDAIGVEYTILCAEEQYRKAPREERNCVLVKLHGSLDRLTGRPLPGIMADIRSVGKGLSKARADTLHHIVRTYSLLFLGYSGRDYFGAMPISTV